MKKNILDFKSIKKTPITLEDWAKTLSEEHKINASFRFSALNELSGCYFRRGKYGFKGSELDISPSIVNNLINGQLEGINNLSDNCQDQGIEPVQDVDIPAKDDSGLSFTNKPTTEALQPKEQIPKPKLKRRHKRMPS